MRPAQPRTTRSTPRCGNVEDHSHCHGEDKREKAFFTAPGERTRTNNGRLPVTQPTTETRRSSSPGGVCLRSTPSSSPSKYDRNRRRPPWTRRTSNGSSTGFQIIAATLAPILFSMFFLGLPLQLGGMAPLGMPLADSKFSLNSAAVAGFFGGKEAISAMATVHLYKGRRWLGWFNSPGSYTVAKRFGRMANARFWAGLFPGPNASPAVSFGLDGKKGPQYIAALSGTEMFTRHLGHLTIERSKGLEVEKIEGRRTKTYDVAYLAMKHVDYDGPVKRLPLKDALLGLIPIVVSIVTCILCALVYDWYSFSMILLGILSSGWASFVIGKGKLVIKSVKNPADGAPPGHGILMGEDEVVVIKGEERDVNAITKGCFDLETSSTPTDEEEGAVRKHHDIGICSLLLILQFLLQLLLIPQASLFGQIMFVASLGISWVYNSYLSSLEKEKIQTDILFQTLGEPEMLRFRAGTRTTMAVFVCLLLFHEVESSSPQEDRARRVKILRSCLANDTAVWKRWTDKVIEQLLNIDNESESLPYLEVDEEDRAFSESERRMLKQLLDDAAAAFRGYFSVCNRLSVDSTRPELKEE